MALQYEVWMIEDPTGTPIVRQLVSRFTPDTTDAWIEFPITRLFTSSTVWDILLVTTDDGETASFTASWNYQESTEEPAAGYAYHSPNGQTIKFNHDDNGTTDRQAALEAMRTGDTITLGTTVWTIIKTIAGASVHTFEVLPQIQHGTKGVGSFDFKTTDSATLEYVNYGNHYSGDSEVQGLLSTTGYANVATDDNAYGVDIEFQPMVVSSNWELLSYNGDSLGTI